MKRWIGSLVLSGVASIVMAQAPFTIVRPADGSRVREKVHIMIPKGSIPPGGYVGVFLDDKLIEAVVPPLKGKYYEYVLDTKGRGIPDTPAGQTQKLELVLYTDYNDKSRIVDRSSVNIRVGNQANIPIPNSGIKLRYSFSPGQEMIYSLTQRISVSPMTEEQNEKGGKAAQFDSEGERIRLSYSVVNTYGNGDGLLRLQAIPMKGKDYADLTASGETSQKRYYDIDMAPLYMRVTSTGHEVFGALPAYVGFEANTASANTGGLYAAFPLPTLPTKAIHVGDSWQSRFQEGAIDLNKWVDTKTLVERTPARGEFVNVEWESGHPCAKIRNVIEAGTMSEEDKKLQKKGAQFTGDKISVKETIWFALDTRKILKIQRDETIDRKVEGAGAPVFGGPSGGYQGGPPPGYGGPPPGYGGRPDDKSMFGPTGIQQRGKPGMPPIMQGPPASGTTGAGPGNRGGGGNSMGSAAFVRIHKVLTFTLEQ